MGVAINNKSTTTEPQFSLLFSLCMLQAYFLQTCYFCIITHLLEAMYLWCIKLCYYDYQTVPQAWPNENARDTDPYP